MRLRAAFVTSAMAALAQSPAYSTANRCAELQPLAAKVRVENEFVQERSFRTADPNWCSHAHALKEAMTNMIQIMETDSNRCRVGEEKIEALQKAADRVTQLSEGCP